MRVPELMSKQRPQRDASIVTLLVLVAAALMGILATQASTQMQQWIIVALIIAIVFLFRRNEVTAGLIVVAEVLLDWSALVGVPLYWPLISLVCASILVIILFLSQSEDHPWIPIPRWWLWGLVLALALYPAYHALDRGGAIQFYLEVLFAPMLMYVIGVQVALNRQRLRALLGVLAGFGAFVGLHSIIITSTGVFLFESDQLRLALTSVANYTLANTTIHRAGSYLTNPDSNGAFLTMLLSLGIGLAWSARTTSARTLYIVECAAMAGGLICTFSIASMLSFAPSLFVFIMLAAGTLKRRLLALGGALLAAGAVLAVKPSLLDILLAHGSSAGSSSLRIGAWETAIRVILAHPLTGIGLSYQSYLARADPYRVALQYRPLDHPHDAFLQLAAWAGIPLAALFIALLALGARQGIRLLRSADPQVRVMIVGILCSLLTLTLNSFAANAWTLPPLAMIGWLLMGAMISPALMASEVVQSAVRPAVSAPQPAPQPVPAL